MNASQNNPSHVFVVNVPGRVDGLYVFASRDAAKVFSGALGDTEHDLTDAPLNESADALVKAEQS